MKNSKHKKLKINVKHRGSEESHHTHHKPHEKKKKINPIIPAAIAVLAIVVIAIILIKTDTETPPSEGDKISIINKISIKIDNVFNGEKTGKHGDLAATVNGQDVTINEINKRFERVPLQYQALTTKEVILNQTIAEMVLLQEAEKRNIAFDESEVMVIIEQSLQDSGVSKEEFNEALAAQNITLDEVVEAYRNQMTIIKLLNETVVSNIDITESEVQEYYNENKDMFEMPEQVRAAHILINFEGRTEEEALEKIEEIRAMVDETNFGDLAMQYSEDPGSAQTGGEYTFGKGQMVPEFEDAAFSLEVGELSEPVKTVYGYHLIKLYEKIDAGAMSLEDMTENIKQILLMQKQQQAVADYIQGLMDSADITVYDIS